MGRVMLALAVVLGLCISATVSHAEQISNVQAPQAFSNQSALNRPGEKICQTSKTKMPNAQQRDRQELEKQQENARKEAERARGAAKDDTTKTDKKKEAEQQKKRQMRNSPSQPPPPGQGLPKD